MAVNTETSLTNMFVSPFYCEHLITAGVSDQVNYQWLIFSGKAELQTRAFDYLHFYKDSDAALNRAWPPDDILPAFSFKDMERLLPNGWFMSFNQDGMYEVSLPHIYETRSSKAIRLPDAFAMLVLESIKNRILKIEKINVLIGLK